jgi:regulatory protein
MNPIKNRKNLEATIDDIRNFAYSYLEKYSPSKQQLRIFLFKKLVKKKLIISSKKEIFILIDSVISSLEQQNLLSDKYYSDAKSKSFLRKGYSLNKIRFNLIKKGIDEKYIKASISKIKDQESDPDFFSAIKICKRRRIGPIREESNRPLYYKKDISILARSGFSYEISKRVLEIPKDEFKKFCKMI